MPCYRALVRGENFIVNFDGKRKRVGFYQTVYVRSADPTAIESAAIQIVREDRELQKITLNVIDPEPKLFLDEIEEIEESGFPASQPRGRSFFDARRWWQFWRKC